MHRSYLLNGVDHIRFFLLGIDSYSNREHVKKCGKSSFVSVVLENSVEKYIFFFNSQINWKHESFGLVNYYLLSNTDHYYDVKALIAW